MAVSAESKMLNPDRVLVLVPIEGTKPRTSTGMIDPKLFTGENKVHVIKEPQTNFWYFKYEQGSVPEPLKCKFTGFKQALKHAELYYGTRNLQITEII